MRTPSSVKKDAAACASPLLHAAENESTSRKMLSWFLSLPITASFVRIVCKQSSLDRPSQTPRPMAAGSGLPPSYIGFQRGEGKSMPTDIYTRQPIVTKSEKHVSTKAFRGRLVIRGCVDKITNDRFGHGIDASLDEALRSIRIFLDARNSDGDPPRAAHHVPGSAGKTYVVEAGGVAMAPPNIVRTKLDGGALRIEGTVPNARSVRDMLRKHARRTGKDLEDLSAAFLSSATHQLTPPPTMTFGLHLWDSEPYRATAKVVCNLLAERDAELFLAPEFDDIRAYVLDGVELSEHPVQAVSVDLTPDGLGPLDHFVKVDVNAAGDVVGLVIYFGLLAFAVRLGRSRRRPQFERLYRVDQLG